MQEAWRTYLELAMGLGEASRRRVGNVVKDVVGRGNATAEQFRSMTSDLLAANAANREALAKLVKFEVDRALGRVGLATVEEVRELTERVRELDRQLREARVALGERGEAGAAERRPRARAKATRPAAPRKATRGAAGRAEGAAPRRGAKVAAAAKSQPTKRAAAKTAAGGAAAKRTAPRTTAAKRTAPSRSPGARARS